MVKQMKLVVVDDKRSIKAPGLAMVTKDRKEDKNQYSQY